MCIRDREYPEVRLEVTDTLAPLYKADEEWESYVAILHSTLDERIDVDLQVKILTDVAFAEEHKLDRPADAFTSLSKAYQLSQAATDVEIELERLAPEVNQVAQLVELFNEIVNDVPDREIEIRIKVAALTEGFNDLDQAILAHQLILEQEPDRMASIVSLERLFTKAERFKELAETLDLKLEQIEDIDALSLIHI